MEKNTQTFTLTWEDLQDLKEISRQILKTNIAVKKFQVKHADTKKHRKMSLESVENSKKGLEMLENIENAESLNDLIRRGVGDPQWALFVSVLSTFSGALCDPEFYKFDKWISEENKKESN